MAGIWNVNSAYNLDSKQVQKKLSFVLGDKFSARIVNLDKLTSEAILKLLDGWQFSAQIKQPIDSVPEGLIKFQVDGYENGKLIIKLLGNTEETEKENILTDTLEEQGLKVKKDDYAILERMIKHRMPLSKDNISMIKSLLDFQEKISKNPSEENGFIFKYLENKQISPDSEAGQKIFNQLKGFFSQFKNLSFDALLTLTENEISLTEENIKSFNNINNNSMHIYKELESLESQLSKDKLSYINLKDIENNINYSNASKETPAKESKEANTTFKSNAYIQGSYVGKDSEIDKKQIIKQLLQVDDKDSQVSENNKDITNKSTDNLKKVEIEAEQEMPRNVNLEKEASVNKIINNKVEISHKIIEQINDKTNEMKEIIKQAIQESNSKGDSYSKVIQGLQEKMNDFKVFNSLSNQYYYLDVPLNINEKQYPCKLIIKDDRKKGKKIDSTNVKFVASVKTVNMGVVDAYIKVSNSNLSLDIKSEEQWVKVIELGKEKIEKKLKELGFITYVRVDKKEKQADLVQCRDFFEDIEFTRINLMV
ncbi:hypothetical protein CLHOM_09310 [Clostridium homopropionicum DSM 5847]|uniref:Flagellar hook-length control protein FliK n=1 Tax=Clostridium homopropionicum DSM 5847 TaxID=1121318 RepID=A0A0L6ZDD0_9CLOT|nr:hypothetical protein [Clostridium homopropionicum]KOA20788.1 hypothetical protein CLHOM_09310 [Clostridium homopropionicum DSM 5847]SFF89129.1 hypothetical protein SAMN04488501_10368 [Clostridium homopropionicum]